MSIQAMKQALEALQTCENYLEHRHLWLEDAAQELSAAIDATMGEKP